MLAQLAAAHPRIAARGGAIVGVAPAAAYQARHLMATSIPFPLYLDPGGALHDALGIRRQGLLRYLGNLPAWWRWLRAFLRHRRQGRVTGHHAILPGIAVVDRDAEVTFVHRGTGLGDYPPLDEVLAALERTIGNNG